MERYSKLYDKQYKFERNQFINPGEDSRQSHEGSSLNDATADANL